MQAWDFANRGFLSDVVRGQVGFAAAMFVSNEIAGIAFARRPNLGVLIQNPFVAAWAYILLLMGGVHCYLWLAVLAFLSVCQITILLTRAVHVTRSHTGD